MESRTLPELEAELAYYKKIGKDIDDMLATWTVSPDHAFSDSVKKTVLMVEKKVNRNSIEIAKQAIYIRTIHDAFTQEDILNLLKKDEEVSPTSNE